MTTDVLKFVKGDYLKHLKSNLITMVENTGKF